MRNGSLLNFKIMIYATDIYTIASMFGIENISYNGKNYRTSSDFAESFGDSFNFYAENGSHIITCVKGNDVSDFAVIRLEENFNGFDLKFCKV